MKPVYLYGKEVERVQEYKYLGTIFDTTLKFQQNTEVIIKKVNQRMYVLRKFNSFCVQKNILRTFYTTFIESILSCSFLCWYSSLSLRNKNRLQTLVRTCSKMIGVPLRSLAEFYKHTSTQPHFANSWVRKPLTVRVRDAFRISTSVQLTAFALLLLAVALIKQRCITASGLGEGGNCPYSS